MKKNLQANWFFYLLIAQPILDIIAFFQYDNAIGSLAGYIRLVLMVVLPIYVLTITKKKKSFICLMAIIGVYCILHILNGFRVGYISIFEDVSYMAKVVQMPVLGISFIYCLKSEKYENITSRAFYVNCFIIFATLVVAHLSGTAQYTYTDYEIGYLGWFANANSQSIIIISLIPMVLRFAIKKNNFLFFIFTSIFTAFLLLSNGTKAAYYAIFIIFGAYAFFLALEFLLKRKDGMKFNAPVIAVFLLICVGSAFAYPYTPRYEMDHVNDSARAKDQEEMDKDLDKIKHDQEGITVADILADAELRRQVVALYEPLMNKEMVDRFGAERVLEQYGWLPGSYEVADMRLKKVVYAQLLWDETDMLTKLVGFEFTNIDGFDMENDYPAIFYYYGYIGFGLYMLFFVYFVYLILRKCIVDFKGAFNSYNFALLLTLGLQLGLAQYSGAILRRPNASIYISVIVALIYYQCTQTKKHTIKK